MIMNETDIGKMIEVNDLGNRDHRVALAAFEVYEEYQKALMKNVSIGDYDDRETDSYNTHLVTKISPNVGLICLDWRCIPTFQAPLDPSLARHALGDVQKKAIIKALESNFKKRSDASAPSASAIPSGSALPEEGEGEITSLIVVSPLSLTNSTAFFHESQFKEDVNFLLEVREYFNFCFRQLLSPSHCLNGRALQRSMSREMW